MSTPLDAFADELRASFARHADGCQRMAAALPEGEERRGYALQAATFQQCARMVEAQRSQETPAPDSTPWRMARCAHCRTLTVHHAEDGTQCCPGCATTRGTPLARALAFVLALCVACAHQPPLAVAPTSGQVLAVDARGATAVVFAEAGVVWLTDTARPIASAR